MIINICVIAWLIRTGMYQRQVFLGACSPHIPQAFICCLDSFSKVIIRDDTSLQRIGESALGNARCEMRVQSRYVVYEMTRCRPN